MYSTFLASVFLLAFGEWAHLRARVHSVHRIGIDACGVCLVALPFCLVYLGSDVYALFAIVWTADTSALVAGRLIGGPRLSVISPQKTFSGLFAAIVLGCAAGVCFGKPAVEAALLALAAQAGDLAESACKRAANVKDSNVWISIPGHGGMLDRIDALLFAAPLALVFQFIHT